MASAQRIRLKYWGQKGNVSISDNTATTSNLTAEGKANNASLVDIFLFRDDTPSLYYDQDELRVQKITELATNRVLSEKTLLPADEDRIARLREIVTKSDTSNPGEALEELKKLLSESIVEGLPSHGDTLVGPLQAIRIGALGRVTAIPASELTTTAADDYGVSADAIDGPTNQFEYDLAISDMMGVRFRRKLESTLHAFTAIVLSSAAGFKTDEANRAIDFNLEGATDKETNMTNSSSSDSIFTGEQKLWDPSVLALWSGKLDPSNAKTTLGFVPGRGEATINPSAEEFAFTLLKNGTPALPRGATLEFLYRVLNQLETDEFLSSRISLKRVDIPPENMSYRPHEICFGAGRGTKSGTYFGTGWSSTLTAELVQIAGQYLESFLDSAEIGVKDVQVIQLSPRDLQDFFQTHYMGYVHLRAAELRRPVFAFICNETLVGELQARAESDGAFNGSEGPIGSLLSTIDRVSSMPEGEPLRRLVEPYVVRVTTSNPYCVATLMQLDNWFKPTALLSSIFTRCFNELSDGARVRAPPSKLRYVNGRREATQETVGDVLRADTSIVLDPIVLYTIANPSYHSQLEGHLINYFMASNRLDDLSHERQARRGIGSGFRTQLRVSDTRARLEADAILRIPASV